MRLVTAYLTEKRFIECQRILKEIIDESRQVHGKDHGDTVSLIAMSEKIKSKKKQIVVTLQSEEDGSKRYFALCYEDDGKTCTIERIPEEEEAGNSDEKKQTLTVSSYDLRFTVHSSYLSGVVNASHLNGKVGEVRSFNEEKQRYQVLFEDSSLKSCLVKPTNLMLLF